VTSAGAASATAAFTVAACAASLMALVYTATQAFNTSFGNINCGIGSSSTAPTSKLLNVPLFGSPYQWRKYSFALIISICK